MNWEDAKKACEALGNGWRLSTKDESKTLYLNKDKISGFVSNNYWSSTESGSNDAWVQNFNSGSQGDSNKINQFNVRAVRTIK